MKLMFGNNRTERLYFSFLNTAMAVEGVAL
jgi:hypothetical protein